MLTLIDNMSSAILLGSLFCLTIIALLYAIATIMDIQMSDKSMLLSIVMIVIIGYHSSNVIAGFFAKSDISDSSEFITANTSLPLDKIDKEVSESVIIKLHPSLQRLIKIADNNNFINSDEYFNHLDEIINTYIWKSLGWCLSALCFCGVPAILFGTRRTNTKASRRSVRENKRLHRTRR